MDTTEMFNKALRFATEIHKGQSRKGKAIPYISHPLAVAHILEQVTKNEDIVIAGILHDTIEDCVPYGSITKDILERMFNADIARMVNDVTEEDKSLPWAERKRLAFEHIKHMPHDSLLVKSADVLHNLSELTADIIRDGQSVFTKFNASKEDTRLRYQKLIPEIIRIWPENPLRKDLESELNRLLVMSDV